MRSAIKYGLGLLVLALGIAASYAFISSPGSTGNIWTTANLTGTDTATFTSKPLQILTLTANETLTLSDGRSGTTTVPLRDCIKLCQNATGNFTVTFSNSNIKWSNGIQPGYTLTANNGDVYCWDWNGTNFLDVGFRSNVASLCS